MKRLPLLVSMIVLLALITAATVFAQDGDTTLDESAASLSIVETLTTSAQVEIAINGEIHVLTVPVSINIDATKSLADALLTTATTDRVGDVNWRITDITEYDTEYDLNNFSTLEPSTGNKLVVITSELTNLDSQPFTYWLKASNRFAYDAVGNLYDEADYECDDIQPGDSRTCILVFDVPVSAEIQGLDVEVVDHKRIPYTTE